MDAEERALLVESLDRLVESTPAADLPSALAEFGWRDLLDDEPGVAVSVLFELQGRHRTAATALDPVAALAAGVDTRSVAVVYPALPSPVPTSTVTVTASGATVSVRGVVAARAQRPETVVVPALLDGAPVVAQVTWRGAWPATGSGIDPSNPWTTLTADTADAVLFTGGQGARRWRAFRAAAHRALAHELYGAGSAMLDLAVTHVATRTQFGRALGSFQAVKHKLADVRLWQECAGLATAAAWEPADADTSAVRAAGSPTDAETATAATGSAADVDTSALLAKLTASRFTRLAREHCQQVLGGMGFTWEHDFHRYVRRALVLEQLLGSPAQLHGVLGADLRATGLHPHLAAL